VLPAAARMRRSAEFAAAFRGGARAGTPALGVHLAVADLSAGAVSGARVGFVVSRSIGGAVARNLVRRRLRHLMRSRLALLPAGAALVVRANPPAAAMSSSDLGDHLDRALARVLRDSVLPDSVLQDSAS
jgi:ribonuclease P protein component